MNNGSMGIKRRGDDLAIVVQQLAAASNFFDLPSNRQASELLRAYVGRSKERPILITDGNDDIQRADVEYGHTSVKEKEEDVHGMMETHTVVVSHVSPSRARHGALNHQIDLFQRTMVQSTPSSPSSCNEGSDHDGADEPARFGVSQNVARQDYDFDNMPLADQPEGLTVQLKDYQRQGLKWMMDRPNGCILDDEMGLGKTVQTIALMHAAPAPLTLLAVPVALIEQWADEIVAKSKPHTFIVLQYHGPKRDQVMTQLDNLLSQGSSKMIVVITSHALLGSQGVKIQLQATTRNSARVAYDFENNPLMRFLWSRVVIDEAHLLRNVRSKSHYGACGLSWRTILLLTGTPLTNNLGDFQALLAILKHDYEDKSLWRKDIINTLGTGLGTLRLKRLTEQLMLRRIKGQVIRGQPITELPDAEQVVIELEMEQDSPEHLFYDATVRQVAAEFDALGNISASQQQMALLTLFLRLRQAACHPFIFGLSQLNHYYAPNPRPTPDKLDWGMVANACQHVVDTFVESRVPKVPPQQQQCPSPPTNIFAPAHQEDVLCEAPLPVVIRTAPIMTMQNSSSKLNRALEIVQNIMQSSNDKVIIFSQFVSFLDICEYRLNHEHPLAGATDVLRIDGKTTQSRRSLILSQFKTSAKHKILLLSFRAAGVGLDLSCANHVLLLDSWWNTAAELQAQDRVNRIGQQKKTTVYRFMMKGTVDERVESIKVKKDHAIQSAFQLNSSCDFKNPLLTTYGNMSIKDLQEMIVPIQRDAVIGGQHPIKR